MSYKTQLRDPRWQRLQSLIRERDDYKCQLCGATDSFLHVHHFYYDSTLKAWEYDHETLTTLCEDCHKYIHSAMPKIISLMTMTLVKKKVCILDIEQALRSIIGMPASDESLF